MSTIAPTQSSCVSVDASPHTATRDSQRPESAWPTAPNRLVHDWNGPFSTALRPGAPQLLDETLRDGLQSASARDPSIGAKIELLHFMAELGIESASIGIPCAHPRQFDDALRLAREIADQRLPIRACCAARTRRGDIESVVDLSQRAGIPIEVGAFVGSSPIRQYVEGWDVDAIERLTADSVSFATGHGLPVLYVTEDTTRSTPEVLSRLYRTAIRNGAKRVCIADTVGYATPQGAARLVKFVARLIEEMDAAVEIDWHGHRDRGFDLANCFAAWSAGAQRCHGTALGIGERSGNAAMELLLVNLQLAGWINRDLTKLCEYVEAAASSMGVSIPAHCPVVGADAFRTATGVHASAIAKAAKKGDAIGDHVYSSIPASMVGKENVIDIGPMSGESNVRYYLARHGLPIDQQVVSQCIEVAKESDKVLSEEQILEIVIPDSSHRESGGYEKSRPNVREPRRRAAGERGPR
jgi:2-isopropylmalate synthase